MLAHIPSGNGAGARQTAHLRCLAAGFGQVWFHGGEKLRWKSPFRKSGVMLSARPNGELAAQRTCSIIVPVYNERDTFNELMELLVARGSLLLGPVERRRFTWSKQRARMAPAAMRLSQCCYSTASWRSSRAGYRGQWPEARAMPSGMGLRRRHRATSIPDTGRRPFAYALGADLRVPSGTPMIQEKPASVLCTRGAAHGCGKCGDLYEDQPLVEAHIELGHGLFSPGRALE
jgi:hypothetical protein